MICFSFSFIYLFFSLLCIYVLQNQPFPFAVLLSVKNLFANIPFIFLLLMEIFATEKLQNRDTTEDISKPQIALDKYTFLMKVKNQIKRNDTHSLPASIQIYVVQRRLEFCPHMCLKKLFAFALVFFFVNITGICGKHVKHIF